MVLPLPRQVLLSSASKLSALKVTRSFLANLVTRLVPLPVGEEDTPVCPGNTGIKTVMAKFHIKGALNFLFSKNEKKKRLFLT